MLRERERQTVDLVTPHFQPADHCQYLQTMYHYLDCHRCYHCRDTPNGTLSAKHTLRERERQTVDHSPDIRIASHFRGRQASSKQE